MPDSIRPSVSQAVQQFLSLCGGASARLERMEAFLENLRSDRRWSTAEVDEVQALIIERLLA